MSPSPAWGVAALLLASSQALAARFGSVLVRGELSGFMLAASGHCYFSLKDEQGQSALVRCAMFRRAAGLLGFAPADGQRVQVRGRLDLYAPRGELQLVVEHMERVGAGSLYEEFLRLKAKLAAQGLFDAQRKRPLPAHPKAIALVTSLGAAALHDVLASLARRAPHVPVVVYPSLVQGVEAPAALVQTLALANNRAWQDGTQVLLLVRGGGSLEDLWAFNDERVVRAVAGSNLPVVCGVGHETDTSLCDLAADVRAPTPTAAAELAVPERAGLAQALNYAQAGLMRAVDQHLAGRSQQLDLCALRLATPAQAVQAQTLRLSGLGQRLQQSLAPNLRRAQDEQGLLGLGLTAAVHSRLQQTGLGLERRGALLQALDPSAVLKRGYAWVQDQTGQAITSAHAVFEGQPLRAVWADGAAHAQVLRVELGRPS